MSRYSGPQGRGAAQKLAADRRTEAEARQREEREREARRRAEDAAAPPVKPLTGAEVAQLLTAVAKAGIPLRLATRPETAAGHGTN